MHLPTKVVTNQKAKQNKPTAHITFNPQKTEHNVTYDKTRLHTIRNQVSQKKWVVASKRFKYCLPEILYPVKISFKI